MLGVRQHASAEVLSVMGDGGRKVLEPEVTGVDNRLDGSDEF